jgi:hypothetical protein
MREMTKDRSARPAHVTFSDEKHGLCKKVVYQRASLEEELKDSQTKP